jgi:predicted TIM-barrel fold metal-dependent hydrolase
MPGQIIRSIYAMPSHYHGPIIDPHHHLWDLSLKRHPWLASDKGHAVGNIDPIKRNYLVEDCLADACRQHIAATVHVEAGWIANDCLGETCWLETLDSTNGVAARLVAHVPLASPDAAALLNAQAGFDRVVGIRDIVSWHEDPSKSFVARRDTMDDPAWRAGLAGLAPHGLHFDLMLFPGQMSDALRLVRDFPDQQFILNHCGSPIDRDSTGMEAWRTGLKALGKMPNLAIKISDLVAYDHNWTLESLRPIVLHCIDCFGPERAMFGSDFPVARLHATFDQVYESFKAIVADFSVEEQRALFFETARCLYRIPDAAMSAASLSTREQKQAQNQ